MFYFKLMNLECNVERRPGAPYWYYERSAHQASQGGRYLELVLGLPGVHIEASLHRRS